MNGKFSNLTSKQTQALPLLASGVPATQIANTLSVSEQAISGWQKDGNFVACLEQVRREAVEKANSELQSIALGGVRVLTDLLHSAKSESVRLKAAQYVCDRVLFAKSTTAPSDYGREFSTGELAHLQSVEEHRVFREISAEVLKILREPED